MYKFKTIFKAFGAHLQTI